MNKEMILKANTGLIYSVCDSFKYSVDSMYTVDDLYQECCMKLYQVLDRYNPKYSLSTFIFVVCRNLLIEMKDKGRLDTVTGYDFNRFMVEEKQYNDEELRIIERFETLLKDYKFKDIVVRVLYGETQSAIAEDLGFSRQYVGKRFKDFIRKVQRGLLWANLK